MFKSITLQERLQKAEAENNLLRAKLTKAESNVDYLSMMSGIDLPEETTQGMSAEVEEGGEDNE